MVTVRTRFAPSPTGFLHIGGVRTALFSWLYAKHHGGKFMLRIEDTDVERNSEDAVKGILDAMDWLGLDHTGAIFQSKRLSLYQEAVGRLLESGCAYHCYCSREELDQMRQAALREGKKPRYDGRCRERGRPADRNSNPVIRFRNPQRGMVVLDDLVQGSVVFDNQELDDLVLMRSNGLPTYNLTAVVDDHAMGITHVIRGDDHLNNTPRQLNIYQAFAWDPPAYAHIPLILDAQGGKLSKRSGDSNVLHYWQQGFLPDALLNYLLRLGWSHGDEELFDRTRMIELFDLSALSKSAARLNPDKLLWLNQHYLRAADDARLASLLRGYLFEYGVENTEDGPDLEALVGVQKHRTNTLRAMAEQSVCFYLREQKCVNRQALKQYLPPALLRPLRDFRNACEGLQTWDQQALLQCVKDCASRHQLKLGKLAQPIRVAVTGEDVSPGIGDTLYLLGKSRTLQRLDQAIEHICHYGD